MPILKNQRHELFAQGLAKGLSADKAYVEAGFKPNRHNAAALARKEHILTRVTEIQSKAVKKVEVTVESITAELEEARALALQEKQTSAAVSASMGKAKLFGLGVERRHLTGQIKVVDITAEKIGSLTADERALFRSALPVLAKLGVLGGDADSGGPSGGGEQED